MWNMLCVGESGSHQYIIPSICHSLLNMLCVGESGSHQCIIPSTCHSLLNMLCVGESGSHLCIIPSTCHLLLNMLCGRGSESYHSIIPSPCHSLLNVLCGSGLFKCVMWGWIWGTSVHLSIDMLLVVLMCCVSARHTSASVHQHVTPCFDMLCECEAHQCICPSSCLLFWPAVWVRGTPVYLSINMLFWCAVWVWGTSVHLSIKTLLVFLTCCVSVRHTSASVHQHVAPCFDVLCECEAHQCTSPSTCHSLFKHALWVWGTPVYLSINLLLIV